MGNEEPIDSYEELKKALYEQFKPVIDHPEIVESVTVKFKPWKLVKELLKTKPTPKS